MIDTIFYFVDSLSLDDYITLVLSGEIASKTIVFASLQKSIYKGGRLFGRMLYEDLKTELEKLFNNEDSPAAKRYIEKLIGLHPYDDAALRDAINQLNTAILLLSGIADLESARLDGVIGTLDNSIKSKIENLLNTSSWVLEHMPKQEITWQAGWDDKLHLYLSTVGYWDSDNEGWTTKYSLLKQSLDNLSLSVNTLENKLYYDGSTVTEAILAAIDLAVRNGVSNLDLGATYAKFGDVNSALNTAENYADTKDGEIKNVIEWMYSGLLALASEDVTFARLLSAGKSGMRNAISEIRTYVEKLKDGDYLATSSVESAVDNAIAGLYNSASTNHASSDMFVKLKKNSTDIAGLSADMLTINGEVSSINDELSGINSEVSNIKTDISTANLITRLSGASNGLVLKTVHTSKYNELDEKIDDNYETLAGLINTVLTDLATYEAGVTTKIDTKLNTVTALLVAKSEVDDGTLAASIMAKVNENGSELTLSADRINMTDAFINFMGSRVVAEKLSIKRDVYDASSIVDIKYNESQNTGDITVRDPNNGFKQVVSIRSNGQIMFADGTIRSITSLLYDRGTDHERTVFYPGGLQLYPGSGLEGEEKLVFLQLQPNGSVAVQGRGQSVTKEWEINDWLDHTTEVFKFTYGSGIIGAGSYSSGPNFARDKIDNKLLGYHTLTMFAREIMINYGDNNGPTVIGTNGNADEYGSLNNPNKLNHEIAFSIHPAYTKLDGITNGLILLTNSYTGYNKTGQGEVNVAGRLMHTAIFMIGSRIRTEFREGIKIGKNASTSEFSNHSQIEILNLSGSYKDTLNKVIPYKDNSGNTKYLGIVGGLIVYDGDGGTNLNDVYTAVGITNPNS